MNKRIINRNKFLNIIDGESYESLIKSISSIMKVTPLEIKNEFSKYPDGFDFFDFINKMFYSDFYRYSNHNYDGIYLFHMTRCTDTMLLNIKKKGLLRPNLVINDIKNDIYFYLKSRIKKEDLNIDNNKLTRDPNNDNNVYAMEVNIINKDLKKIDSSNAYHFLDKFAGPEYIDDILRILKAKYCDIPNYHNYTKPYIIKIFVSTIDLEKIEKYENIKKELDVSLQEFYLIKYLFILYNYHKQIKMHYSSYICNNNCVKKIIELEE